MERSLLSRYHKMFAPIVIATHICHRCSRAMSQIPNLREFSEHHDWFECQKCQQIVIVPREQPNPDPQPRRIWSHAFTRN